MFNMFKKNDFIAPMTGKIIPLESVDDEVFSAKMLGDGFAIELEGTEIFSPTDGVVKMTFPTGHAIGILSNEGYEYMLHIGIDTVKLNGTPFKIYVKEGDIVIKGQKLIDVDLDMIKKSEYALTSPVVFTNGEKITLRKQHVTVCAHDKDIVKIER